MKLYNTLRQCLLLTILAATNAHAIENVRVAAGETFLSMALEGQRLYWFSSAQRYTESVDLSRLPALPITTSASVRRVPIAAADLPVTLLLAARGSLFGGTEVGNLMTYHASPNNYEGMTVPGWSVPYNGPITFSAGKFYYGLGNALEFPSADAIYRRGGYSYGSSGPPVVGRPELFKPWSGSSIKNLVSLQMGDTGYADIVALRTDGSLQRTVEYPLFGGGVGQATATIASGQVQAVTAVGSTLYFTQRHATDASIVNLKSAVGTGGLAAVTVTDHGVIDEAAATQVAELTVIPSGTLAFMQVHTGSTKRLVKKALNASTGFGDVGIAQVGEGYAWLRSTETHVYFLRNSNTVAREATSAPVQTRDLAASGLEVVQSIQNPGHQNTLIEGKITHVRFFARLASSSPLQLAVPTPNVVLEGSVGGVALPGSPLRPVEGADLVTVATISRTQRRSNNWVFRLPDSWTRGTINLTATMNQGRGLPESNVSNNTSATSVTFQNTGAMNIRFVPTKTDHGMISRTAPEHQSALDYLAALIPATEMRYTWRGGEMHRPLIPFYCDGSGRYAVRRGFDDGWLMLMELLLRNALDGAGPNVHYVSLCPDFDEGAWSGLALPGIYDINLKVPSSAWMLDLRPNANGVPFMSGTAAQELAHNFGRQHVNCGNPDFTDNSYPYDVNMLSSTTANYVGFDPLTRAIVHPGVAKDYMSYCSPKWTSDYTWKSLASRMPSLPPGTRGVVGSAGNTLIAGHVDHHGNAYFVPLQGLSSTASRTAAQGFSRGPQSTAFKLFFRKNGADVASATTKFFDPVGDNGASGGSSFITQMDLPGGEYDSLALVDTVADKTVGALKAGVKAPKLNLVYPLGGEIFTPGQTFTIDWNASDDDPEDTLWHTVRWSNDKGVNWSTLLLNGSSEDLNTAGLRIPGKDKDNCMVEVTVTDGLHATSVRSGVFTYPNSPPQLTIQAVTPRGTSTPGVSTISVMPGESVTLRGIVEDLEDGPPPTVAWDIIRPNGTHLLTTGSTVPLASLVPGQYLVNATTQDSDGDEAAASCTLKVHSRCVNTTTTPLVLDGHIGEEGWAMDTQPTPLPVASGFAQVRMVHYAGALWVGITGLAEGNTINSNFTLAMDLDNSRDAVPTGGDRIFRIHADGSLETFNAYGNAWHVDAIANLEGVHVVNGNGYWSAELRIPDSALGGWDGREVGAALFFERGSSTLTDSAWPGTASVYTPSTWTSFCVGADTEDLTDTDGDTLPDAWELTNYGTAGYDPVKNLDTDNDGQADTAEHTAGTDPKDARSRFHVNVQPGVGFLTWPTAPCRSYTVSSSTDLQNWLPVATGLSYGSWYFNEDPSKQKVFYRISAEYAR